MARPSGPNCDIGAYEFQDVSPPPDPVITQAPPDPRRSLGIDLLHRRRVRRRVQLLPGRWTGDDLRVVRHVRRPHGGRPLLLRASRRRFGERVVGRVGDVVRRRLAAARPRDRPGSARPERSLGIGLLHGRRGRRGVQLSLDGGPETVCTSPATYDALAQGPHSVDVRAVDSAGNASGPASSQWTVVDQTLPPDPVITQAPPDPSGPSVSVSFTDGEAGVGFTCSLDGGRRPPVHRRFPMPGLWMAPTPSPCAPWMPPVTPRTQHRWSGPRTSRRPLSP